MKTEIEVKFLVVDFDSIRQKLKELGAVLEQPMRLMKRVIMDDPAGEMQNADSYIRIRDEGHRVTLTYKKFDELSVDGAKEIELTVDSFENAVKFCEKLGLATRSVQESRRETWRLGNVEVVLDEWPWLKPYIEIEGESESEINEVASQLGFDWGEAVFGDVMVAYCKQYPHLNERDTVGNIREVRFNDPLPDLLKP